MKLRDRVGWGGRGDVGPEYIDRVYQRGVGEEEAGGL